jgi:hypothetical protein
MTELHYSARPLRAARGKHDTSFHEAGHAGCADLSRKHFYTGTIKQVNCVRFDLSKLDALKAVTIVSFDRLNAPTSFDGTDLILK